MKTKPVLVQGGKRYWHCDGCGKIAPWGPTWSWYGSWADWDDRGRDGIVVVCGQPCLPRATKRKMERLREAAE